MKHPFEDVLGLLYQELGSRGKRSAMGQFFTPGSVSVLISAIVIGGDREAGAKPDGGLWRACEPACSSGALTLGFLSMCDRHGLPSLRHWSVTAIDLDPLCTTVCAAQVLANLLLHRGKLGEFVVYQGNPLGPSDRLSVVVHMTVRDLSPDLILPARHPSRLASLRSAARTIQAQPQAGSAQGGAAAPLEAVAAMGTAPPLVKRRAHGPSVAVAQEVDLFAE